MVLREFPPQSFHILLYGEIKYGFRRTYWQAVYRPRAHYRVGLPHGGLMQVCFVKHPGGLPKMVCVRNCRVQDSISNKNCSENCNRNTKYKKYISKLDGCIALNEHNTVLGSKGLAMCATVYVGVQK